MTGYANEDKVHTSPYHEHCSNALSCGALNFCSISNNGLFGFIFSKLSFYLSSNEQKSKEATYIILYLLKKTTLVDINDLPERLLYISCNFATYEGLHVKKCMIFFYFVSKNMFLIAIHTDCTHEIILHLVSGIGNALLGEVQILSY